MAAPKARKSLMKSRRRMQEEDEEEGDTNVAPLEDDSISEGSVVSDADLDADGEASDESEVESPQDDKISTTLQKTELPSTVAYAPAGQGPSLADLPSSLSAVDDTTVMLNGLGISHLDETNEQSFEESQDTSANQAPALANAPANQNYGDQRRREHEEYRKRRDADPAFVPNRGGFFMHDHRSSAPGPNGFRPYGRGRGRGRGAMTGSAPIHSPAKGLGPADNPWAHDLHESVAHPEPSPTSRRDSYASLPVRAQQPRRASPNKTPTPNRSFSKTTKIGTIQVRVLMTGMSQPTLFSGMVVYLHTRLPHHRPPLRRDKPVRICLPRIPIRYIFPSDDRSFIFIPRALRPTQTGFSRVRGRGSFGASYGNHAMSSSKRTSLHGGSTYSPSLSMSRRSSLARESYSRNFVVPYPGAMDALANASINVAKPVVRLPPFMTDQQYMEQLPPTVDLSGGTYQVPSENQTVHEHRGQDLPMHHPRPERSVQVADIETPAAIENHPPPIQQQQPFHQQVPLQMGQYSHSRHPSQPSQASGSTPLLQISETAVHAQPFQPYGYASSSSAFYPPSYSAPMYYYPTEYLNGSPAALPPSFVPGQQYYYPLTASSDPLTSLSTPPQPQHTDANGQFGTVAHETGGMVYYYNPTDLALSAEGSTTFLPSYANPATPDMQAYYQAQAPAYYSGPPPPAATQ